MITENAQTECHIYIQTNKRIELNLYFQLRVKAGDNI